jgi:hypothetical protein
MMSASKFVILLIFYLFSTSLIIKQDGKCDLQVLDACIQEIMGKNVGFFVKFKNNSSKNIHAFD